MTQYYQLNPKVLRTHLGALQFFACHGDWYREIVIGVAHKKMWSKYESIDEKLDLSDCFAITRHQYHLQLHRHILINNQMNLQHLEKIYQDLGQSFVAPEWEEQVKYNKLLIYKDKLSTIIEDLEVLVQKPHEEPVLSKIERDLILSKNLFDFADYEFQHLTV
jgi:hypothetical protein